MEQKTYQQILDELEALPVGTTVLISAREVKGGKLSLEFAEKINGTNGINLVSMLNKSDDRFNSGKPVRAWQGAEPADFEALFGINLKNFKLEEITTQGGDKREVYPLGIIDPVVQGSPVKLEIRERMTINNDWEKDNLDKVVKQNGTGQFLVNNGQPIIRDVAIVAGTANHTFIQHTHVIESLNELGVVEMEETEEATA